MLTWNSIIVNQNVRQNLYFKYESLLIKCNVSAKFLGFAGKNMLNCIYFFYSMNYTCKGKIHVIAANYKSLWLFPKIKTSTLSFIVK